MWRYCCSPLRCQVVTSRERELSVIWISICKNRCETSLNDVTRAPNQQRRIEVDHQLAGNV
jgi:hypothetical protein